MHKLARLLVFTCFFANAQRFTPGNIVVTRVGNGSVTISTGLAAPVFLDEYSPSGLLLHTHVMPTVVSGTNKILTNNGSSTAEGTLSISADGQFLVLCGYNAAVGTAGGLAAGSSVAGMGIDNSSPSIINRVVGTVDYLGNINTTTALTDAFDKTNIRSAVSDNGNNIWICGSTYSPTIATSGVRYTTVGSTTSTKISNGFDNAKVLGIAGNQLFATSGTGSFKTINSIGNGLPTTSPQTATNLNGIPTGSQISPVSFVFFDVDASVPGPDLLYICDDGNVTDDQGLNKYSFDGTIWTKQGRLTDDCSGVTGYIDCNGSIVLFITSNSLANNKIYKFTDLAVYNASITGDGNPLSSVGMAFGNSAGLKQVFRGIQMAPGYGRIITATDPQNIVAGSYNKITIKNGANAVLTGNITIADKLLVEAGATLDCGNFIVSSVVGTSGYFELQSGGTLKIGSADGIAATAFTGNIQTCTRRYNSGGNYEYNGTVAQNTGDGIPAIISGKLTLNNSSNIILSTPIKVSGSIDFHTGRLQTNSNIVTITSATTCIGYTNSYVQTAEETSFIDGPAKYESSSTNYQIIPIGKGKHFAAAGLTPYNNILKTYQLEYFAATPTDPTNIAGALHHISQLEYWDIACSLTNNPDKDAKITLYWSPNSVVGNGENDAQALPDLRIAHYKDDGTGFKWRMDNAGFGGFSANGNINYGNIAANDFASSFSPFILATKSSYNLLPIHLIKWTAIEMGRKVQLEWQATGEENINYYSIERSSQDAQHFISLKMIKNVNPIDVNTYTAIDENPFKDVTFYRLAMVDKSGKTTYSSLEKVWMGSSGKMTLYPSPAKDFVHVNLPAADGFITLTDAIGKPIKTLNVTSNSMLINLQSLAAGTYFINYNGVKEKGSLKFVKLR